MVSSSSNIEENSNVESYNVNNINKAKLKSTLTTLLSDPILADVSKNPTFLHVDTLISLELGSAMRISVLKLDRTSFDVAVMISATVKDLKLAIKQRVNDMEQSKMGHRNMYDLSFAYLITTISYLTTRRRFRVSAFAIIPRYNLSLTWRQRILKGIQKVENTVSFMGLTSVYNNP